MAAEVTVAAGVVAVVTGEALAAAGVVATAAVPPSAAVEISTDLAAVAGTSGVARVGPVAGVGLATVALVAGAGRALAARHPVRSADSTVRRGATGRRPGVGVRRRGWAGAVRCLRRAASGTPGR